MELGLSGAGGGLTERLFDASLLFGKELAAQQLNLPALSAQKQAITSSVGPGSVSFSNDQAGGFDQKTILLLAGAALLIYLLA